MRALTASEAGMVWTWARTRHLLLLLAASAALGATAAVLGAHSTALPTLDPTDDGGVQLWRVLTVVAATLPALALHSPLADLEAAAATRFAATTSTLLLAAGPVHLAIYVALASVPVEAPPAAVLARAWIGWCGLALITASLLRPPLAWTGPVTGLVALVFWGDGGASAGWWELDARPSDDPSTWALATTLLAIGLLTRWATPWRRHRRGRMPRTAGDQNGSSASEP